jgi:hypothetical protein
MSFFRRLFLPVLLCSLLGCRIGTSTAQAAVDLPFALVKLIEKSCIWTFEMAGAYDGTVLEPALVASAKRWSDHSEFFRDQRTGFLNVFRQYSYRQVLDEHRQKLFVLSEMEKAVEYALVNGQSPPQLAAYLERGAVTMGLARKKANRKPIRQITLESFGPRPRHKTLAAIYDDFVSTKLGIYFIDLSFAVTAHAYREAHDFHFKFRDRSELLVESFARDLNARLENVLFDRAFYFWREGRVQREEYIPPGVYIADYYNVPDLQPLLVHQMARVYQGAAWNYPELLNRVVIKLRQFQKILRMDWSEVSRSLLVEAQLKRTNFFSQLRYAKDRKLVEAEANKYSLSNFEWVMFFDLVVVLGEMDALLKEGLLAAETKSFSPGGTEGTVVSYVKAKFENRSGIQRDLFQIFQPEDLIGIVTWLNRNVMVR